MCVARSPEGGPCHENQICRDDAYCHEGRCAPRVGVGEQCGGRWRWCQDGLFCDGHVPADVPPRTRGCNSAHHCDVATRTCKLQLPLGARCEPVAAGVEDSPCFLGECDPRTRKCAAKCPRR